MEWHPTFMPTTSYRHFLHYVRASAMPVISHLVFSGILLPLPLPLRDGRGNMPVAVPDVGIVGAYIGHGLSLVASSEWQIVLFFFALRDWECGCGCLFHLWLFSRL